MTVASPENRALVSLRNLLDAGRPLVYVQSPEEDRVLSLLRTLTAEGPYAGLELRLWSLTEGMRRDGQAQAAPLNARQVLDEVLCDQTPAIFLLRDYHEFLRDSAEIRRRLRDVYHACLNTRRYVVICSPIKFIPGEIERELAFVKLPVPDRAELERLIESEAQALGPAAVDSLTPEIRFALARSLQGLTFDESRHALRFAFSRRGRLDDAAIALLQEEKRQLVHKSGLMEFVPDSVDIEQLGGLDLLKKWLIQRRDLFYARDELSAELVPKGILLMGVSGCGKSLSARVVANVFGLPLYRVDMSQVFSAGIGQAERIFAEACRTMEEIAPAVVWFDEIENAINRQHNDSTGVLDRIFGYFLTWMQEKPKGLFVAATANRIDLLPAEMIRKGRFDQVFFIDLPDYNERMEIFRIHLQRRGVDPGGVSLELCTVRTEGWTGAEIEQCVISALTAARLAGEPVSDRHLLPAINETVPLSKTMQEQVKHIRAWASDRAVCASSKSPPRRPAKS